MSPTFGGEKTCIPLLAGNEQSILNYSCIFRIIIRFKTGWLLSNWININILPWCWSVTWGGQNFDFYFWPTESNVFCIIITYLESQSELRQDGFFRIELILIFKSKESRKKSEVNVLQVNSDHILIILNLLNLELNPNQNGFFRFRLILKSRIYNRGLKLQI